MLRDLCLKRTKVCIKEELGEGVQGVSTRRRSLSSLGCEVTGPKQEEDYAH